MTNNEHREKLFSHMLANKFSVAEFLYVMDSIDNDLMLDMNITTKQLAMVPMIKTLLVSSAMDMDEDKMGALVFAIIQGAEIMEIPIVDLMFSMVYIGVSVMQTFGTLMSERFEDIKKEDPGSFDPVTMKEWLSTHVRMVTEDDIKQKLMETLGCKGECATCERCPVDDDSESTPNTNLH